MTNYNTETLVRMLSYMRPAGSKHNQMFCDDYLKPIFGDPDEHGNYILIIGDRPSICFTSHHDTVHMDSGFHKPHIKGDMITTRANCLGADCTTGVYLMLAMIKANVNGVYVVHAAEEIGCLGSSAMVKDYPIWLDDVEACISFDRRGYDSIVTHQMGLRTCSDVFAKSLAKVLDMPEMLPDDTGVYTDSNEYAFEVNECTNISVGYFNQHGPKECQSISFVEELKQQLINADWSKIVISRDHEKAWDSYSSSSNKSDYWSQFDAEEDDTTELEDMSEIIRDYPYKIAEMLQEYGFSVYDLEELTAINT